MTKEEFNLLYAIKKYGIKKYTEEHNLIIDNNDLFEKGLIDSTGITEKGLNSLKPYKVDNALIMAAGISKRFSPISIEKPKGLLQVKNEVLVERQINQLIEANINNIVIVVGYKKEEFYYLKEKYKDIISFIENDEYITKNNSHTIYLAKDILKNTYICSSDNYFKENPFDEYNYESYYSVVYTDHQTDEWYVNKDENSHISKIEIGGNKGLIMLGHAYWTKEFSKEIIKLLEEDKEGNYDTFLWETILKDNLRQFPPMEAKKYKNDIIFEFDSLEELKSFDSKYINNSESIIIKRICEYLNCQEKDLTNYQTINFSEEDYSFSFEFNNNKYIYHQKQNNTNQSLYKIEIKLVNN